MTILDGNGDETDESRNKITTKTSNSDVPYHKSTEIWQFDNNGRVTAVMGENGNMLSNIYETVVQREERSGCEVESHTYDHKNLNILTFSQIQSEIDRTNDALMWVLGHKARAFENSC